MTDPASLAVLGCILILAGVAAWYSVPSPPALDAERWRVALEATLWRGRIDAEGGDAATWRDTVARRVPFHPRRAALERVAAHPAVRASGATDPDVATVAATLAAEPDRAQRWRNLLSRPDEDADLRHADPADLGLEYDPRTYFGPGRGWDWVAAHAADDEGVRDACADRVGARWLVVHGAPVDGRPAVAAALAAGEAELPWHDSPLDERLARIQALGRRLAPTMADRLILVGEGEGIVLVLRALQRDMELRDRVVAVLSVGGSVRGMPGADGPMGVQACEDWLGRWFSHEHLDTDLVRRIPYFCAAWLDPQSDPPGAFGLPISHARFPEPRADVDAPPVIEPVDLGLWWADASTDPAHLASALRLVVSMWVLSRDPGILVRPNPASNG